MARTKLEINAKEFQDVVNKLEAKQKFVNPSALWQAVEKTEWAKSLKPRPLTAGVAYQRAKELGITTKTKPGKRGRQAGEGFPAGARGKRGSRSEKMKDFPETFVELRKKTPERWSKTVDKAEKGSLRAALALFCLECVAWEVPEIKKCTCTGCPLYPHRPYKQKVGEDPDIDNPEEEVDCEEECDEAA